MLNSYRDIRSRISEEPSWYDCNGTPRYGKFEPSLNPNIYATEVVLVLIECQSCGREFHVELNWGHTDTFTEPLSKSVYTTHYGDPPAHNCIGDTMNSIPRRVVQFWQFEEWLWGRRPDLEVDNITPKWAEGDKDGPTTRDRTNTR